MIKPMNDRVVAIRVDMQEHLQKNTFLYLGTERAANDLEYRLADVVAVGPGVRGPDGKRVPMPVEAGQRVLYRKFTGIETELDGESVVILKEAEIQGVVEE
jgi:chaperonin GroES